MCQDQLKQISTNREVFTVSWIITLAGLKSTLTEYCSQAQSEPADNHWRLVICKPWALSTLRLLKRKSQPDHTEQHTWSLLCFTLLTSSCKIIHVILIDNLKADVYFKKADKNLYTLLFTYCDASLCTHKLSLPVIFFSIKERNPGRLKTGQPETHTHEESF